jgi:hypothetical protein
LREKFGLVVALTSLGLLLIACDETPKSPYLEGWPPRYVNPHYGVDVAIPEGMDVCVLGDGITISHGFVIPLTKDPECKLPNPHDLPNITAFFDFGALYDQHPPALEDIFNRECDERLKPIDKPDLGIPGHATAVCRGPDISYGKDDKTLTPNGLIDTTLFTWVGGEHGTFFQISLATTESRYLQDIEALKRVLPGIKFTKSKSD